jgi:hypothetical protein
LHILSLFIHTDISNSLRGCHGAVSRRCHKLPQRFLPTITGNENARNIGAAILTGSDIALLV